MRLSESGFGLYETMTALVVVALIGMLVVRSSGGNALVRTQSAARAAAVSLATELSEWTRRRGEALLGTSLAEALAEEPPNVFCDDGGCDAADGARYYIAEWKRRLQQAIPDARAEVCLDHPPVTAALRWACDASGSTSVLKLGWPSYPGAQGFRPAIIVELGSLG